ncbi:MAG: prepilin-type N-terminal cleavage/methylation domain-containing protein, partial [Betaproteobacteria bacterium]|nr:prepilin-type N-terminal cleavage/methylation domain-containing protein [Betaproteobacteria bacterium]
MSSRMSGFTLIEVMVALLLLAIMSMLSWRALDSMVRTREALAYRG